MHLFHNMPVTQAQGSNSMVKAVKHSAGGIWPDLRRDIWSSDRYVSSASLGPCEANLDP